MAVSHPTPGRSSSCCCFRTQGVLAHADEVVVRARTSCLFICPLKRKCASSLKRRTSKRGGCSGSVCWYSVNIYSLGSCWPGFEPRESALCMETVSDRYEGLSSHHSWKSPLPVTAVWWTFVVTVPNESSSPEGLLMFWQSNVHHCGSCCWLPHCQSLWTSVSGFGWCCKVVVSSLGICDGIASGQDFVASSRILVRCWTQNCFS